MIPPFHLAIHVTSLEEARDFYGTVLGAEEGRSTETWVDFDLFGHQFTQTTGESVPELDLGLRHGRCGQCQRGGTGEQEFIEHLMILPDQYLRTGPAIRRYFFLATS